MWVLLWLLPLLQSSTPRADSLLLHAKCDWTTRESGVVSRIRLADEVHAAEDIAIGYADVTRGIRSTGYLSNEVYEQTRDDCLGKLFTDLERRRGVTMREIQDAIPVRHRGADLIVILSFIAVYYAATAPAAVRHARAMFPDDYVPQRIALWFMDVLVTIGCVGLGQVWSILMEGFRVNNKHLSYRMARIPWGHYWPWIFLAGLGLFWLAEALTRAAHVRASALRDPSPAPWNSSASASSARSIH